MPYNAEAFKAWSNKHRNERNAYLREWCKKNPEARFMRYWRHRLKKYGLTPDTYAAILKAQDGKCLICTDDLDVPTSTNRVRHGGSAVIDHDHLRKTTRAILCNNCNRAIGLLRDNPNLIMNAYHYLRIMQE